jgi:hypothetical protein
MTHPNMKSRLPALMTLMGDHAHFRSSPRVDWETPRPQEALRATDPRVAANDDDDDDEPRKWYQIRNPLWVIAFGMGFLFAAMALIVALG